MLEIENLHWIDPSSEEVVAALVERLVGARILLLLTYRPGYRPPWIAKSYATQLALAPLRSRDSRRVVQAIIRTAPVPEPVVQAILARAEGNPLFLEELAQTVKARGDFQRALAVPMTLQAGLAARIDRLPPEAKHVLQMAAVIGKEAAVPLLEAVAGLPSTALRQALAHLQAAELLYEQPHVTEPTVTFKHALIQGSVYQLLLKSTRQRYHQQVAQALAERFPETAEAQPALLAQHFTEAGLGAQAIPYWLRAGRRALEHSACREAVVHLAKGLEVLETLPDTPERTHQALHLLTALGPAFIATKGLCGRGSGTHLFTGARAVSAGRRHAAALPGIVGTLGVLFRARDAPVRP